MLNREKVHRMNLISTILQRGHVQTLSGLKEILSKKGIRVSLATLSRDLKELGYTRAPAGDGSYRIVRVDGRNEHIDLLFKVGLEELMAVGNFVVIKTRPGNAQAVAGAIDRTRVKGILGTVAGDDTIFAIIKNESTAHQVANKLRKYIE